MIKQKGDFIIMNTTLTQKKIALLKKIANARLSASEIQNIIPKAKQILKARQNT